MLSPNYIISQVFEMQQKIKKGEAEKLDTEYSEFKQKFPPIFAMASKAMDESQMEILLIMLKKCQNINENKSSLHDSSVDIGQILVDKYVKPVIDRGE